MAVACDEGVYRIAKEIQLKKPEEFGNIVLCLGPFHMIKVVQASIGQYIDGSGAETIWTKNGVFGVNVVKQVLSGKHYKKSLYGLYILSEAIQRLQLEEFFRVHGCDDYVEELNILKCMKVSVGKKDKEQSKKQLSDFMTKSDSLIADFKSFKEDMATKSETFKFWDTFVCMVALIMDLVHSVKEGNWLLHLHTVKCILPLFSIFNRTNYLRWCSLYLEDMQKLEETAPDVYQYFMSGKFAVKHTAGKFKAVTADQCLEQTINRSQKSNAGVIGTTKRKEFVAQWEIIYHETLDVVNLHREICGVGSRYSESDTNHEFNETLTKQMEEKMTKMLSYIHARENPAKIPSEIRLHNILSQAIMSEEIRQSLLSVFARGNEMYQAFRNERYINKTKAISDTISRSKVKTFKSAYEGKSESDKKKATKKESTEAQRIVDVAKERNYDLEHLLKYDLVESSILFENNFMIKPAKSTLCPELEKKLKAHDYSCPSQWSFEVTTTYVVDVMGQTRRVPTVRYKTFEEYVTAYFHQIDTLSEHAAAIHLVFDSYIEGSVKDSERLRRNTTPAVEISMINDETLFPDELDSFWASSGNKEKLQLYLRDTVLSGNSKLSPGSIILSGMGVDEENMIHCTSESGHNISELDKDIEEADLRIIQHILYAIKKGAERIVMLSNDTDVLVLVLHYMAKFRKKGVKEVLVRGGKGNTIRYIPVHKIADNLGKDMCKVLPAAHILTGCDSTSKVGTKHSCILADPIKYLSRFGLRETPTEADLDNAEAYLVQVLHPGVPFRSMDQLRYYKYYHSKHVVYPELPPTSYSLQPHILRCWYNCYLQLHCLAGRRLNPLEFGYEEQDSLIIPLRVSRLVPDYLVLPCTCKLCATQRCPCRKACVPCCIYCGCRQQNYELSSTLCKNPNVMLRLPVTMDVQ